MIDRTLNYGRHLIKQYLSSSGSYRNVLDIGAGHGHDLLLAREVNPSCKLFALESLPESVDLLKNLKVEVQSLDVEKQKIPFKAGQFDVVIANQILEHTKEIFWIFHQISRVLADGGHLIVGVPNLASLHNRVLLSFGLQPSSIKNNSSQLRGFTKPDLLQFVESCFPGGYKLLDFGGGNFYPFPPLIAKPLARLLPTLSWGIFFHFQKVKPYHEEFLEYPQRERLETNFYVGRP